MAECKNANPLGQQCQALRKQGNVPTDFCMIEEQLYDSTGKITDATLRQAVQEGRSPLQGCTKKPKIMGRLFGGNS